MRATSHIQRMVPKVREHAEITMSDGMLLDGYVFVDATSRIQDLLNDGSPFMPFVEHSGRVHLLNKAAIVRVLPYD